MLTDISRFVEMSLTAVGWWDQTDDEQDRTSLRMACVFCQHRKLKMVASVNVFGLPVCSRTASIPWKDAVGEDTQWSSGRRTLIPPILHCQQICRQCWSVTPALETCAAAAVATTISHLNCSSMKCTRYRNMWENIQMRCLPSVCATVRNIYCTMWTKNSS